MSAPGNGQGIDRKGEMPLFAAFKRSGFFVFVFLIGLLVGVAWKPIQTRKSISSQPILKTVREKMSIPELVSRQLESGDLTCPNSDPFTYEACLLYQGALGIWQRIGLPEICPAVIGGNREPPFPKEGSPSPLPKEAPRSLLPADALRAPTVTCFSYLYAIQVANATPVLVSTSNRTFKMESGKPFFDPGIDPDFCIEARHGICGNQAALGVALFEAVGLKSRSVEFYYYDKKRLNHIIPEVMIDGDWRPVDTTYGAYWASNVSGKPFALMALDDLLYRGLAWNKQNVKSFDNSALLPYGIYNAIGRHDYFGYLKPGADILRGGRGEISLLLEGESGVEKFTDLPNYIGDNKADGEHAGVSFKLNAAPGKYGMIINVSGSAFGEKGSAAICIDGECMDFSEEKKIYRMTATNPGRLYLKSEMDVSYVVLASIEWKMVD